MNILRRLWLLALIPLAVFGADKKVTELTTTDLAPTNSLIMVVTNVGVTPTNMAMHLLGLATVVMGTDVFTNTVLSSNILYQITNGFVGGGLATNGGTAWNLTLINPTNQGVWTLIGTNTGAIDLYATNAVNFTRLTIQDTQDVSYTVYLPMTNGTLDILAAGTNILIERSGGVATISVASGTNSGTAGIDWDVNIVTNTYGSDPIRIWSYAMDANRTLAAHDWTLVLAASTNRALYSMDSLWTRDAGDSSLVGSVIEMPASNTIGSVTTYFSNNVNSAEFWLAGAGGNSIRQTNRWRLRGHLILETNAAVFASSPGSVQFSNASYSVAEDVGNATLSVRRVGGADGAMDVTVITGDGTAIAGQDYTYTSNVLSWADGNTALKTVDVPITDDAAEEQDQTFTATLTNLTAGTYMDPTNVTITIQANDAGITIVPLDLYSNDCVAAYSLSRKLRTNYTGYAFEILINGTTYTNIGFLTNLSRITTDTTTISNLCGTDPTNLAVVTRIYDQMNGYDVTNSVPQNRPTIWSNATMIALANGSPAMRYAPGGYGHTNLAVPITANMVTIVAGTIHAYDLTSSARWIYGQPGATYFGLMASDAAEANRIRLYSTAFVDVTKSAGWDVSSNMVCSTIWNGAASTNWFNDQKQNTINPGAITPGSGISFGGAADGGRTASATLSEFLVYGAMMPTNNLNMLHTNLAIFYGTPY